MDILLFALFNLIAFFFLIMGMTRQDTVSKALAFVIFLIIGFLTLSGGITNGFALNGFSYITASNCTSLNNLSTNCTYSVNATAPAISDADLITDDNINVGIVFLYILFGLYILITGVLNL